MHYIYGLHAVSAVIDQSPERILDFWVAKDKDDTKVLELENQVKSLGFSPQKMTKKSMDDKAETSHHQGVLIRVVEQKHKSEADIKNIIKDNQSPFFLILDGITDPHNLGACLRTADAAGVDAVIVPKDNSANINATVCKVACGASETIPLIPVTNLVRTLRDLKASGVWIYGAAGEADSNIYQTNLNGPVAVVMGSEGCGMRRLTRETCDTLISIPMSGYVSSLNVSVATGVVLYEAMRQRIK